MWYPKAYERQQVYNETYTSHREPLAPALLEGCNLVFNLFLDKLTNLKPFRMNGSEQFIFVIVDLLLENARSRVILVPDTLWTPDIRKRLIMY